METFFQQSRKENLIILNREKYECSPKKQISFHINSLINSQTIIYCKDSPVIIAWDKTLTNKNILIRTSTEFLMNDTTSSQKMHDTRNGMTIVIKFSETSKMTETLYQEVKSILSGELQEQLQKIL